MATIDIRRGHSLGKEQARKAAETIAERLKSKLQIEYGWEGDSLKFKRSGASGQIRVDEKEVRVEVDLGMMLRPLKGTVEQRIQQYLDEGLRT